MTALPNPNHEKFAHAMLETPSYTQAYKKVYPVTDPKCAGNSASRLLAKPEVQNRISELLVRDGIPIERLNKRLACLLDDESSDVSLRSVRLGYELHGALDRNAPAEGNKEINIQINIMGTDVTI